MKFTRHDMSDIMNQFPHIELSYEKNLHKKVYSSNIYLTIPKGKKYFTWFRNWKNKNICLFLELDRHKKNISGFSIKNACFDKELCCGQGTIFYGTCFYINGYSFFNIEDLFCFKGNNTSSLTQNKKFGILNTILKNYLRPVIFTKQDIAFGLPVIDTNHDNLVKKIQDLPYEIYAIQHRLLYKRGSFLNEKINISPKYEFVFTIKATIKPDIYELYYMKNKNLHFYKYAAITDYKTSVFMNNIFRDIKENGNLDALEESDDEEEFENIADDKYVDLDKALSFKCVYLKYYKSWKPLNQIKGTPCNEKDIMTIGKYNTR